MVKNPPTNAGGMSSIPGWGRSPGEGNSNPFHYSCLENPHGQRSLVGYSPWGLKELDTTERLSTWLLCMIFWGIARVFQSPPFYIPPIDFFISLLTLVIFILTIQSSGCNHLSQFCIPPREPNTGRCQFICWQNLRTFVIWGFPKSDPLSFLGG